MTQPQTNEQLAQSLGAVQGSINQMQASLASGELSIDPEVGKTLRDGYNSAIDHCTQLKFLAGSLSVPARLGTNTVSTSMAGKFAGRAEGDAMAISPLLEQFHQLLAQMRDTVDAAITAYDVTDKDSVISLGGS